MSENKESEKKLHLKITTHEKVVFDGDVDEIYSKGTQGEFGILPGHIPFMTGLEICVTKAIVDGKPVYFSTMGGILQLKDNVASILTQASEKAEEIDIERAEEAKKRAKERLEQEESELDLQRAEVALARALARIKATKKE